MVWCGRIVCTIHMIRTLIIEHGSSPAFSPSMHIKHSLSRAHGRTFTEYHKCVLHHLLIIPTAKWQDVIRTSCTSDKDVDNGVRGIGILGTHCSVIHARPRQRRLDALLIGISIVGEKTCSFILNERRTNGKVNRFASIGVGTLHAGDNDWKGVRSKVVVGRQVIDSNKGDNGFARRTFGFFWNVMRTRRRRMSLSGACSGTSARSSGWARGGSIGDLGRGRRGSFSGSISTA